MSKKEHGMVLMIALIFLLVLTLLALGVLSTSQLQLRMSHNWIDTTQEFQAAEAGLSTAEKQLPQAGSLSCFSLTFLSKQQGINPWLKQNNSCEFYYAGMPVYYFIERLPGKTCVITEKNKNTIGAYYRITAWVSPAKNYSTVLQSTDLIPLLDGAACKETPVYAGRLSWKELN